MPKLLDRRTDLVECPAPGCDLVDNRSAVKAHLDRERDAAHATFVGTQL
jgi:hypothetical protein